ncbi:Caspase-9 [Chionoecetes opilio]|nr:Caspase-9 [Chionoecetes opilio]
MSGGEWRGVLERVEEIATEVVEWDRTWDVIYSLHQRVLLTQTHVARLRGLNTRKEQVRQLVALLAAAAAGGGDGSDGSLNIFLEVLLEQGMEGLVRRLDPNGSHSPDALGQQTSAFSALRLTPYQHPSPQWVDKGDRLITLPGQSLPTLPLPGHDITNNNKNDNSCTDNNNTKTASDDHAPTTPMLFPGAASPSPRVPLSIRVVPCRKIGGQQFPKNLVYQNESEPRGHVFLANYKDFVDGMHAPRLGSEIDVANLGQLFSQMGYKTSYHINMTKWDTIQALRDFRNQEEHSKADSCIVVFMSHGRDDRSFFTSDNQYLTVHSVVERFNNRECPILKGKPKIFIFQFCRGSGADIGVDAAPRPVAHSKGLSVDTDSSAFGETLLEKDPTFTDMYIVYSTVGGFVSFRSPESGSWLVEAICKVFMRDACDTELEHLMKNVSRQVRSNFSTEGNKQACEFVQRAFDRHFYFNPRPLASLSGLNLRSLGEVLPSVLHPVRLRRRIRTSSPAAAHRPGEEGGARSRHFSGESTSSEQCFDNLDVLDHPQWAAHALHPRIRNLSLSQRRLSEPEASSPPRPVACGRSFSQLNSVGFSSESCESLELGASRCTSSEVFSPLDNPQQHWNESGFPVAEISGGDAREIHPDAVMEMSLDSPHEPFPLNHSQSALEAVSPSELGGVTGAGPELRAVEGLRPSFKRQLSAPSNNETLQKVNDVRRYLQVNEVDEALLQPLKRIESFINKKKKEGKRRKVDEPSSLDY